MKKQEQEAKEQSHQGSQSMSKSLLTEELTKEAYQSYCRISEQERHIAEYQSKRGISEKAEAIKV